MSNHEWGNRDGFQVCFTCGVVKSINGNKPCTKALPKIEPRTSLPITPEAIAQRCWEEAMAWLFREAYIVRPVSGHFRELYTGIVNGTLSSADVREKARDIMFNGHEPTTEAFGMLQVIARGRPDRT